MNFFDPANLRAITAGQWLQRPPDSLRRPVTGVGIDSRENLTDKAFLAIKGERHDGHDHLHAAAHAGAILVIVEREPQGQPLPAGVGVLLVKNTRQALARIAQGYRRTLRATKIIAVTGSAGKTTTKRLIHSVLATEMNGSASPKSFNNDIGVPLTILQTQPADKFLVVEIGTNHPGEIGALASIAEPDLAVITCIGRAHLEGLGSIEAIADEKASLLTHLREGGVAVVNADSPLLRRHLKLVRTKILFGEAEDAELRLTGRGRDDRGWWLEINNRQRFTLAMPGKHNAINALAAVAVGRRLGLNEESIAKGLAAVEPAAMRMTVQLIGGMTIYNDAYNANPDSMAAALATFAEVAADAPRRIVVLGDMLELGPAGPELHREVGRRVDEAHAKAAIDHAVFIGALAANAAEELRRYWNNDRVTTFETLDVAAISQIAAMLRPGDAVLLKASRGMELERLPAALQSTVASAANGLQADADATIATGSAASPAIRFSDRTVSNT